MSAKKSKKRIPAQPTRTVVPIPVISATRREANPTTAGPGENPLEQYRAPELAAWEALRGLLPDIHDGDRVVAASRAIGVGKAIAAMAEAIRDLDATFSRVDWADDLDDDEWISTSAETRLRAKETAANLTRLAAAHGFSLPTPRFEPTAAGGIDLHWKYEAAELLLAIPANGERYLRYFGDTPAGEAIKGTIDSAYIPAALPLVVFIAIHEKAT